VTAIQLTRRLPDGYAARIRPGLRRTDELLVGGSPLRAVRLSARARSYLDGERIVVGDEASAEIVARLLDGNLADPEPAGLVVEPADVTVVVPVRDRPEQLDRCLAALNRLLVIVVDDASRDRAAVAAVAGRHGSTLVSLDQNVGPAAARNAGLAHVGTRYVAFVDSDVEVAADILLGLAAHFGDERVALVGPLVEGVSRAARPRWFERYDVAASSLDLGRVGARVRPGSQVAWLPSACLVGRTETIRAVGGFDGRMRVGEDVDLVWRLDGSGSVVRYDPTYVAHHDTRDSLGGWLGRKFLYGTGGAALASRHGDAAAPAALSATAAAGAAAVILRRRWSLPVAVGATVVSARALHRQLPDPRLDLDIAARGLGWAVRQESALLLRHWWPAAALACAASANARRMVTSALVVDALVAAHQRPGIGPLTSFAGRRLDDLAYGAGLWVGALRARSTRCLRIRGSVATRP
jgi:mycofactocin system glycosyltransferase